MEATLTPTEQAPPLASDTPTRPVRLAKDGDDCAWTQAACHRSQEEHGRSDDCPVHPWASTRVPSRSGQSYPSHYPLVGHRMGLRANDMISLASAFAVIANHGGTAYMVSVVDGSMIRLAN